MFIKSPKVRNAVAGAMAAFGAVAFTVAPAQAEDKGYSSQLAKAFKAGKFKGPSMGAGTRG